MNLQQTIAAKLPNRSLYTCDKMNYCSWMIQAENIGETDLAERLLDNLIALVEGRDLPVEVEKSNHDWVGLFCEEIETTKSVELYSSNYWRIYIAVVLSCILAMMVVGTIKKRR